MKREPQPYTTSMMSTRQLDMRDPRHFKVVKARSSTEADRRASMPSGSANREHQLEAVRSIKRLVIGNEYGDPATRTFFARNFGAAARISGIYTSATGTADVMNRVTDMPVTATDDGWTMTESGLLVQTGNIFDTAIAGAEEAVFRRKNNMEAKGRMIRIGRTFGSLGAFLFNVGQPLPGGTPFERSYVIRERVMDAEQHALRRQVDEVGEYSSLAAHTEIDSRFSSWMRRNVPTKEGYDALVDEQEQLRDILPR